MRIVFRVSRCEPASDSDRGSPVRSLWGLILAVTLVLPTWVHGEPRSVLYREFNVAAAYDGGGIGLNRTAPPTSVGFEFFQKYAPGPPGRLSVDVLDLYARLAYTAHGRRLEPRFEEAWLRFADPGADTEVRIGRFAPPFGLTPTLDLRGDPLLPLLELDLGILREWGIAVQTHARGFVYEAATTWSLTGTRRRPGRRPLLSARVGVPTFRDVRYGLSGLVGTVSAPGDRRAVAWRLAADAVYHYHEPFTELQVEASLGADDHRPVWGLMARLSQILPQHPRWQVLAQVRRLHLPAVDDEVERAFGVSRSLPYLMTLRVLWLHRTSGGGALLVQLHYYAP